MEEVATFQQEVIAGIEDMDPEVVVENEVEAKVGEEDPAEEGNQIQKMVGYQGTRRSRRKGGGLQAPAAAALTAQKTEDAETRRKRTRNMITENKMTFIFL